MFKADLERRLRILFGMRKVTFSAPSDSFEQDTLFIDILEAKPRLQAQPPRETARVTGLLTVYSQANRLPFGFFAKGIERCPDAEIARPFFFYEIDQDVPTSPARTQNIHERHTSFTFLYDSQYDPNRGQLTSVRFDEE